MFFSKSCFFTSKYYVEYLSVIKIFLIKNNLTITDEDDKMKKHTAVSEQIENRQFIERGKINAPNTYT